MLTLLLIFWGLQGLFGLFGRGGATESYFAKKNRLELQELNKNLAIQSIANRLNEISSHTTELNSTRKNMIPDIWYPKRSKFHKTYDN